MRREMSGYSIRGHAEWGTGLVFLVILAFPILAAVALIGPTGILNFAGPILDGLLSKVGAPSVTARMRSDTPPPSVAAPIRLPAADWSVTDGHFYTQTNGQPTLTSPTGFLVSNSGSVPFWDEYRRLGGDAQLGFPVTRRFTWRGATTQVFQRGAIQSAGAGKISIVNVMDELTVAEKDDWLFANRFIPKPLPANFGLPGDPIAARIELLNSNRSIALKYQATPLAIDLLGLPTSAVTDMGPYVFTLRTQRAALHLWKTDGPWGKAGDVTIANSGQIALENGLFDESASQPEAPPPS